MKKILNKFFNKKIGLLPYIREDISSLSTTSPQVYGWEIEKFNIPSLWSKSQGEGVVVGVIDTGCDFNHEDIKDNILQGINFVNPGRDPMDVAGHGTHVSSTIAASNNGTGMVGVAPKTKIVPIKALGDDGNGRLDHIVKAIIWAADRGVDFISMSLGSPAPSRDLEQAIEYAASKGCIIFCAAGNSGPDVDIMYPAKYDHTIAIGAVDENLNRTSFTCSGDSLDFLAPGHNILGCVPGNNYAMMSGTSMSNPFFIGCSALLLSYLKQQGRSKPKSTEQYIDILKEHTTHLRDSKFSGQKKYEGYGVIDPRGLL